MEWRTFIDGIDAYDFYRLSVSNGSYKDLACLPKLKNVPFNDWHERNGIDPDLSAPVLDAHEITIDFYIIGSINRYYDFMQALSYGAYHTFRFDEIGLTSRLRMVKTNNVSSIQNLHKFSVTFCDNEPLKDYEYYGPTSALVPLYDYMIDGKDVSDYGIRILRGTYDAIVKQPDVKENLKTNIQSVSGQSYDGENVTYKTRTVALNCLMRTRSLDEFWQNRNALLYDLIRPDARTLKVARLGKEIPFYYKSCNVKSFHPDGGNVWFEFTLNVEFFQGVI